MRPSSLLSSFPWRMTLTIMLLLLLGAPRLDGQQKKYGNGKNVRAHITSEKFTYSRSDTARLQISLTNTSNELIVFAPLPPPDLVHLVVNRNGKLFQPNITPRGSGAVVMPLGRMKPHETWTLKRAKVGIWLPITDWGYKLQEPGQYTIEVIPQIVGQLTHEDFKTVRSNKALFTIEQ